MHTVPVPEAGTPSTLNEQPSSPSPSQPLDAQIESAEKENPPAPESSDLISFPDPYVVGSTFASRDDAMDALLQYTVSRGLSYSLRSNDNRRVIVVCRDKQCPFRLRMKVKPNQVTTSISRPHNCAPEVHYRWRYASSVRYLRLNHQALYEKNRSLTPKQLQAMERSRGNIISYSQAWRAITAAKKDAEDAAAENMESAEEPSAEDKEQN